MGDVTPAGSTAIAPTGGVSMTTVLILLGVGIVGGMLLFRPVTAAASATRRYTKARASADVPMWKTMLLVSGVGLSAWYAGKQGWL